VASFVHDVKSDESRSTGMQYYYVMDHSPDHSDLDSFQYRKMLRALKESGIQSVRYDWRWKLIETYQG
jgi:hypothetical protein